MKRGAGMLMPIFSLPNKGIYGTLGKEAYDFVDFLVKSKQKYWQVLPINEVDVFGSPFSSPCIYSGNPLFIDLVEYISKEEYHDLEENKKLSHQNYKDLKMKMLSKVFKKWKNIDELESFKLSNDWVIPYSEFMTIREKYGDLSRFPKELKNRDSKECREYLKKNEDRVEFYVFCQYLFFKQWYKLKEYANKKGILIIGDSPCNSSMDSKEAWADSSMYLLDENLTPTFVAGVPPDYFSSEGQVWNTLIYNYEKIKEDNYKYLIDKYKYLLNVYDYLKIDHFRGLEYFYKIPYGSENGKVGQWVPGPGYEFIDLLKVNNISNLILEDLGIISDGVIRLKQYSGYPGMKVYQFAFDDIDSPFLPTNYSNNCVAYTGTHDNDTLYSFLSKDENKKEVKKYLNIEENISNEEILLESIRNLYYSKADLVIINPQDLLFQGSKERFNTPGTINANWSYCSSKKLYEKKNLEFLSKEIMNSQRSE